jgi:competence protein ComEC
MHHSLALAYAAAAWIAGTVACAVLGIAAWPLTVALAAILATVAVIRADVRWAPYAIVLPTIFIGGMLRFHAQDTGMTPDDVAHYIDGPAMRIRGEVRSEPALGDTTQRFVVDVREIQRTGEWQPASGGVQIVTGLRPLYVAGDILEIEGRFEAPAAIDNFDYAEYLAHRGIHSVMPFPESALIGHEDAGFLRESLETVRAKLSRGLALALPEPRASLAQGVLLGERSALPSELRDDLNTTNTSHLVVVSGGNIVIVAAIVAGAFTWLVGRRRAMWLALAAIVAYMLLVGLSPPVVRGTIMGALLVIAQVNGRRSNGMVAILVAAAIMVGVNPHAIRDVSFQLSFAATAGIIVLGGPLHDWILEGLCRVARRDALPHAASAIVVGPLSMTLAAIIATEPLVALHFGRLSLVAVPANMLVVPAFPLILGASAVAAVGGLSPYGSVLLVVPAYYLLSYWIAVVEGLASVPAAAVAFGGFTSWSAIASYTFITAASFAVLRRYGRPRGGRVEAHIPWSRLVPAASIALPVAVLVATAGFVMRPDAPPRLRVTVLDVGQGDAILIQTPAGADILIDGGPGRAVLRGIGQELAWHDRSIELVILTHPDADHAYGLFDVLDRYGVGRVVVGPSPPPEGWYEAVSSEGLVSEVVTAGTTFDLGGAVRLEVLWPHNGAMLASDNDASLVLRLVYRDVAFILAGDIEAAAEADLVASGIDLAAAVLKVPHHGSVTSSTREFLDAVQPAVSVISAGAGNQFGHPKPEVVGRLSEYGVVLNTAEAGSVAFETDGARLWVYD